jgi:hypothetical protein
MQPKLPEPAITRDDARGLWIIDEELVIPSRGYHLVVPKGFETDLASIPRLLWPCVAPFELSCVAPIVHDFLYQHGGQITTRHEGVDVIVDAVRSFTKSDADLFLLDLMQQEHVPAWRAWSAYYAVKWFGHSSWQAPKSLTPFPPSRS